MDKAKQVILEIAEVEYTLEYNRASVKRMENNGFSIMDSNTKLITSLDLMIEGALYKNHPRLTRPQLEILIDTVYAEYDVSELMTILFEMMEDAIPDFGIDTGTKKDFKIVR